MVEYAKVGGEGRGGRMGGGARVTLVAVAVLRDNLLVGVGWNKARTQLSVQSKTQTKDSFNCNVSLYNPF